MKDWILIIGALGFTFFGIMETIGILAAGVQWWINLFS